jgi:hypothetical protein
MNLTKFLKGTITIGELEQLPNKYIQVLFKQYTKILLNPKAQEAYAQEQMADEIKDQMGG